MVLTLAAERYDRSMANRRKSSRAKVRETETSALETTMTVRRKSRVETELWDYLGRVGRALQGAVPDGEWQEMSPPHADALSSFGRIRSVFAAIQILLEAGFPEEAAILARSLFESSLRLEKLANETETERERLILGEVRAATSDAIKLYDIEPRALGTGPGMTPEELAVLEERLVQIERRRTRLNLGRLRRFPGEKDMAKELGRLNEYLNLRIAHHITHGSPLAQATRTRYPGHNEVAVHHRNTDIRMLNGVGTFAAVSALRAQAAVGSFLEFVRSDVGDLLEEGLRRAEL
jgi:hypothetical protein